MDVDNFYDSYEIFIDPTAAETQRLDPEMLLGALLEVVGPEATWCQDTRRQVADLKRVVDKTPSPVIVSALEVQDEETF